MWRLGKPSAICLHLHGLHSAIEWGHDSQLSVSLLLLELGQEGSSRDGGAAEAAGMRRTKGGRSPIIRQEPGIGLGPPCLRVMTTGPLDVSIIMDSRVIIIIMFNSIIDVVHMGSALKRVRHPRTESSAAALVYHRALPLAGSSSRQPCLLAFAVAGVASVAHEPWPSRAQQQPCPGVSILNVVIRTGVA
jgi:hypothetical protein